MRIPNQVFFILDITLLFLRFLTPGVTKREVQNSNGLSSTNTTCTLVQAQKRKITTMVGLSRSINSAEKYDMKMF